MRTRPIGRSSGSSNGIKVLRALIGAQNGTNTVFTTPEDFLRAAGFEEEFYINGIGPLLEGVGNDYVASESGGISTGFDTITVAFAPQLTDNLLIKYII